MNPYAELIELISEQTNHMHTLSSEAASRRFECLQWVLDITGRTTAAMRYRAAQSAAFKSDMRQLAINTLSGGAVATGNTSAG